MMNKKFDLQKFTAYPVHSNVFEINIAGRTSNEGDYVQIKDLETFEPAIEGEVVEWSPMDLAGWARRVVTGKKLSISFSGKRNFGDQGNDYVAGKMLATGPDCESRLRWTLPNGAKFVVDCVINLTSAGGGDSIAVDALEFEVLSDGKPTYTPASSLSTLTLTIAAGSIAGKTKVSAVSPTLTGGNQYVYKIGATLGSISGGMILNSAAGWTPYTLNADIAASAGQTLVVCEVTAGLAAVKGGSGTVVVA